MNVLFCALNKKEFHRVLGCSNAYRFGRNLKLFMKVQIKSKSLKSVDILDNTNYSK